MNLPVDATHVIELLNETKNRWFVLWAYQGQQDADAELIRFKSAASSRDLRVRKLDT